MRFVFLPAMMICFLSWTAAAVAQENENSPPQPATAVNEQPAQAPEAPKPDEGAPAVAADSAVIPPGDLNPNDMEALVLTYWERAAISDARRSRGLVRPPSEAELANSLRPPSDKIKPPPEEREIKLQGIVYISDKDWAIWLNGKRVTPKALPKEVLDLKVHKQYVEMKWFDEYTNQIFPIRLRSHQRFNIDTRIFLPG